MKVRIFGGSAVSDVDMNKFELQIEKQLPKSFKEFVAANNGAKICANHILGADELGCNVSAFIPLSKILSEKHFLDDLADSVFPIAWAEGGNYIVLDLGEKNSVFFWDHEIENSLVHLSNSFGEFLEILTPFDIDNLSRENIEVVSKWIDQDFLKGLKES